MKRWQKILIGITGSLAAGWGIQELLLWIIPEVVERRTLISLGGVGAIVWLGFVHEPIRKWVWK